MSAPTPELERTYLYEKCPQAQHPRGAALPGERTTENVLYHMFSEQFCILSTFGDLKHIWKREKGIYAECRLRVFLIGEMCSEFCCIIIKIKAESLILPVSFHKPRLMKACVRT